MLCVLSQGLIQNDTSGGGEIEASDMGIAHGDSIAAVLIKLKYLLRQPCCFLTEDQEVAGFENRGSIRPVDFFRQKIEFLFILSGQKSIYVFPIDDIHVLPVIESGPFEVLIIGAETQGLDQMQGAVGGAAQAGDTAGVRGDFGLDQNDVKQALVLMRHDCKG